MTVREANSGDKEILSQFQQEMAIETEGLILDKTTLDRGLETILTDPAKGMYFVAENNEGIAGCLMVTPEWSDWRNGTVWWIQSVYIKKEFRRTGVYRTLYQHIKDWVNKHDEFKGIRLYVEKDNKA